LQSITASHRAAGMSWRESCEASGAATSADSMSWMRMAPSALVHHRSEGPMTPAQGKAM
jgi:hypothetical protein